MSKFSIVVPWSLAAIGMALPVTAAVQSPQPSARIAVDLSRPGAPISPLLYGIFFEEINRAGDGGIYAEMVQNRSFEDADYPVAWTLNQSQGAVARISLDKSRPLNPKNPTSLRLTVSKTAGGRAAIVSKGFAGVPQNGSREQWQPKFENARGGIAVEKGKQYDLSFYARARAGFSGPLVVSLEREQGGVLASQKVAGLGAGWRKYSVTFTASASEPDARLVLSTAQPGTVWLDMVSMFPRDTWKGRRNGLRADLMQYIQRIHPAFVRFPGGCFVEGDEIQNRSRWKETIGNIAWRPGHWNLWGYRSTDGLGFLEYLQMCEDLKAEPLFVINVGMSHHQGSLNAHAEPMDKMHQYVQDALDAIEYANGPVTSKWGALRARHGHPKPFNLKYLEIGNENGGPAYHERYAMFHDAIKKRYPKVQLVACDWGGVPKNRPLDIIDPHLYSNPATMISQANRFDDYDRKGPKVYFGEYAVTTECGTGNLQAAVAEAAFMTGFERNGDIVAMSSYAPLLSNIDWKSWNPNAIVYDQKRVYGTPSYHVQTMFGPNRADVNLPVKIEQPKLAPRELRGRIGVGTWATQAEFKDIRVTKGGRTLFASDFSRGLAGWKPLRGQWSVVDGALRQSGNDEGAQILAGDASWSDYTLRLKARKLGGNEGFLISFQLPDDETRTWWNLGGWSNTSHALEIRGVASSKITGRIETGRWYDIRLELQGNSIRAYLDGQLIQEFKRANTALFAIAGRDRSTGETILKVVNTSASAVTTKIDLPKAKRVQPVGRVLELSSASPLDENTFAAPTRIAPRAGQIRLSAGGFTRVFPPQSVTVIRFKAAP